MVGPGDGREAEDDAHHLLDLLFFGSGRTRNRLLYRRGAVLDKLDPRLSEGEADHALGLGDRQGRGDVFPEIEAFHPRGDGLPFLDQGGDGGKYVEETGARRLVLVGYDAAVVEMTEPPRIVLEDAPADGGETGIYADNAEGRSADAPRTALRLRSGPSSVFAALFGGQGCHGV